MKNHQGSETNQNNSKKKQGYPGLILGSGGSPGEGNGNLLKYFCVENSMDGGT